MYWILQLLLRICSLPITPAIHQLLTEVFRSDLDESQELITIVLDINYLRPLPGFKSIGFLWFDYCESTWPMMPRNNNIAALKSLIGRRQSGLMRLTSGQLVNEGRWSGFLLCLREERWAY